MAARHGGFLATLLCAALVVAACGGGASSNEIAHEQEPVEERALVGMCTAQATGRAGIAASAREGHAPLSVTLSACGYGAEDRYRWGGAAGACEGAVCRLTLRHAGVYTATLEVTGPGVHVDDAEIAIRVDPQGARVLAEVVFPLNAWVDGDTNLPSDPYTGNDTRDTAQPLGPVGQLRGFLSAEATGREGDRFAQRPDRLDVFRVRLEAGQTVAVVSGKALDADLTLVRAEDQSLADAAFTAAATEALRADRAGAYFIEVSAAEGAGTYALHLYGPDDLSAPEPSTPRLSEDFRVAEAVVQAQPRGKGVLALGAALAPEVRVIPLPGVAAQGYATGADVSARARLQTLRAIRALSQEAGVQRVEPNYLMTPRGGDALRRQQWGLDLIGAPQAWRHEAPAATGARVVVAVLDSGVWSGHPDLAGQLLAGWDAVDEDADPEPEGFWHGTAVAGIVAAATGNTEGVAGVAPHAAIMPVRVIDAENQATYADVIEGMDWAWRHGADVANLSLSGRFRSRLLCDAMTRAREAGVIVVAALGNQGHQETQYPAGCPGVVGVSAVDRHAQPAPYSNFGGAVDVSAPGGVVSDGVMTLGIHPLHLYRAMRGTSAAAPHVAGVAALARAMYPALSPQQFDRMIFEGSATMDAGPAGRDSWHGYGLIDARGAVVRAQHLAAGQGFAPGLEVTVAESALDAQVIAVDVGAGARGAGVAEVGSGAGRVVPVRVDAKGMGAYRLEVDRAGLPEGRHEVAVWALSSSGERFEDHVVIGVGAAGQAPRVGALTVVLHGPYGAIERIEVPAGQRRFELDGLPQLDLWLEIYSGSGGLGAWCARYPQREGETFYAPAMREPVSLVLRECLR